MVLAIFAVKIEANIDASDFGVPQTNHQEGFGAQIQSLGLADEGQSSLQLVDEEPAQDSPSADVNHVKEMFANAFNSIQAQRELAQNSTVPSV
ncbi:unnamed protein product [Caenorhabditis angaria]|uniref:Uncharacterized protein n=1 Tax=Caenorhabditis angaria TaxID=860376 RepID=A0A9P1IEF3_9PELO|nr:unnamed protein product [Caenorhabditis angaria]